MRPFLRLTGFLALAILCLLILVFALRGILVAPFLENLLVSTLETRLGLQKIG